MASCPALFAVHVVESDGNGAALPSIGSSVVGLNGVAYNVVVSWNEHTFIGPCQFRLHIDGRFVGYTRVRDVGHCSATHVVFEGFLVTKGTTENARGVLEYRHFKFVDAHRVPQSTGGCSRWEGDPEEVGRIRVEVYLFERGGAWRFCRPQRQLYGGDPWDGVPSGGPSKKAQCLTTGCGDRFYKTENFVTRFRMPGRAVGSAIFATTLRYDTAAALAVAGILKPSVHKDIIDWAVEKIAGAVDSGGVKSCPVKKERSVRQRVKQEDSNTIEIVDLSGLAPLIYTCPRDRAHEICDLTGDAAVWREESRHQDVIDLTGTGPDDIANELALCHLGEDPAAPQIEYMEIDSD